MMSVWGSPPKPVPGFTRPGAPILRHLHNLQAAIITWFRHWEPALITLILIVIALIVLSVRLVLRHQYRHGPGLAHARQVFRVGSRRALKKSAPFTRPGWGHHGYLRASRFYEVGARIGRIGFLNSRWFGMSHEEALGIFAPQRQGKTRRLLARLVGDSPGTVIMASTKPDLLKLTWRLLRGRQVHVLDIDNVLPVADQSITIKSWLHPQRTRVHTVNLVGWDPVVGCEDPSVAINRAECFVGDGSGSDATNSKFFAGAAAQVLRCYFHAAALHRKNLGDVQSWAANRSEEPVKLLISTPNAVPGWGTELASLMKGESAGDIFKQLGVALKVFSDPKVTERTTKGVSFNVDEFLLSGDALFVIASEQKVNSAAYTTAFIDELITRAQELANSFPAGRHEPPLTITIDELPGVATMPTFPNQLADSGGRGISIRWAAQGRAFLKMKWGLDKTAAILENTSWKILLRGLSDEDYLRSIENLAGNREVKRRGSMRSIPIMPQRSIRVLKRNHALVIGTALHMFRCGLRDIRRDKTPNPFTVEPKNIDGAQYEPILVTDPDRQYATARSWR